MRSWPRRVVLVVLVLFGLSVGVPAGVVPENGGFPLGWLVGWMSQRPTWASGFPAALPTPLMGMMGARGGHGTAEQADANRGNGRQQHKVANGLDGYRPHELGGEKQQTLPSGFDARTSVRQSDKSSAQSTVWRNADGSFTRHTYQDPVNYRAADGTWQPIDSTLKQGAAGRWQTTANSLTFSLAGTRPGATMSTTAGDLGLADATVEDLVTLTLPTGEAIGYSLEGATLPAPTVSGSTVLYAGALPQTDVKVEVSADRAKESLVLHSASAPTSWVYRLNLSGVTPSIDGNGDIVFTNTAGQAMAWMPKGFMKDSSFDPHSGDPVYSHAFTYELITIEGEPAVRATVDAAWLADPARVFPVIVDPTLHVETSGDTYVRYGDDVDHSGEDTLKVGTSDSGTHRAKSLLHFDDFQDTFAGKRLSAVSLHAFLSWQYNCTGQTFSVMAVNEAWAAASVRWGSETTYGGPALSAALGSASPNSADACGNTSSNRSVGDWVSVDLSVATFNNWITGVANYGLAMSSSDTNNLYWKQFTSRNGPSGAVCDSHTCAPYLSANYSDNVVPQVDARYPANDATVGTLTPAFTTRAHDPDNWPAKGLKYQYKIYTDATFTTTAAVSPWLTTPGWTVQPGALAWNKTYFYTVQVDDYSSKITNLQAYAFSTSIPQPTLASKYSENPGKGFDPSTGNYTTSATDVAIAGVGPSLEITRHYNSNNRTSDTVAFGLGWTSVIDMRATQVKDAAGTVQTVAVRYPTGQEVAFGRNNDGSFTPPMGRYAVFKPILSGTTVVGYSLTDKDATTYTFSQADGSTAWKISSITDANGRTLTFTYDSSSGRLSKMISASNRSLYFEWSTPVNGPRMYVSRVYTDPAIAGDSSTVKSWIYNLNDEQLMSVCAPASDNGCTTYTYSWISQGSNAVLNTGPYSYWRLGDATGSTAKSSVLARAGADNGVYNNVTVGADKLYNQSSTSAAFNGTSSSVQLPGKLVTDNAYQSISMWFKTSTAGGVLFSYSASPLSGGTTTADYVPALYVDANGYLRGEFWQGAATPIKSLNTVTDNVWHHVVLSGAGGTQTLYVDGVAQGSLAGTISLYQAGGSANEYLGAGFVGGTWPNHANSGVSPAKATYFTGQISDAAFFTKAVTSSEVTDIYNAARWTSTELNKITRPSGRITAKIAYDTATAKVTTVTDENNGVWTLNAPTIAGDSDVYAATVLGSKPANYWRLGDPAGTTDAVNEVAGGTASYAGTVTFGATGPFADQTAVAFDGATANLQLPSSNVNLAGPASISLWFTMPKSSTAGGVLYGYQNGAITDPANTGSYVPALYVGTDGKLRGGFWTTTSGSIPITSTTSVADGAWHNVTLSASTTSQTLYLDGVAVGTKNIALAVPANGYSYIGAGKWANWAGANTAQAVGYFPGSIAEAVFFNSALSAADIAGQYAASKQALTTVVTTVGTTVTEITMPTVNVSIIDPDGHTMVSTYDLLNGNRIVAMTDAEGNTTRYGYDSGGFANLTYDADKHWVQTVQDSQGNTIQQITCQEDSTANCSSIYYEYYSNPGNPVDPRNNQLTAQRDGRSDNASDNRYKTSKAYDASGNLTTITDPLGRVTATTYTSTTTPSVDGGVAPTGLPTTVTQPNGAVQKIDYFANGDIGQVTTATGTITTFTYDSLGRKISEWVHTPTTSHLTGPVTYFAYDDMGRLLTQTDPAILNRVTGATHTKVTTNVYNADGNVTSTTISDTTGGDIARTETYGYDAYGRKSTFTDAMQNGVTTTYGYDNYGHLVSETDSLGGRYISKVDSHGNLLEKRRFGDQLPIEGVLVNTRTYSPGGRLLVDADPKGQTQYEYLDNGLLAKKTRTDGTNSFVVEQNYYDLAGNVTKQLTNNGTTTTTYDYDLAGRRYRTTLDPAGLNRVTEDMLAANDTVITTKTSVGAGGTVLSQTDTMYDPEGRVLAKTVYNGDPQGTPVARWKLDDGIGSSALDSSGNAKATATQVAWASTGPPGHAGSASFAGSAASNVNTDVPLFDPTQSFSVSAWAKIDSLSSNEEYVVNRTFPVRDDKGEVVAFNQGSFTMAYSRVTKTWYAGARDASDSWTFADATNPAVVGAWTHLTATYDAPTKTLSFYVNGVLNSTKTNTTIYNDSSSVLTIGAYSPMGNNFSGSIADVQVYTQKLAASRVTAVYGGSAPAATASVSRTSYRLLNGGMVLAATDPTGNTSTVDYDEAGRPASVTGVPTRAETVTKSEEIRPTMGIGYNTFGDRTDVRDANGGWTQHIVDRLGREYETRQPGYTPPGSSNQLIPTTTRVFDTLNQLKKVTDPLGEETTYEYDQLGHNTKVTAADDGITTSTYDTLGNRLTITDPSGAYAEATYDYLGRQTALKQRVRQPALATYQTDYAYGTDGRLASVTTPGGVTTTYTYNPAGDTLTSKLNGNRTVTTTYDWQVKTTQQYPDNTTTVTSYDPLGRVKSVTSNSQTGQALATTSATYDAAGRRLSVTNAEGATTKFTYDATGLLASQTEPISATDSILTTYGYDAVGNRTRYSDGRGNNFWTTYNTLNLPESQIEPATTEHPNPADRTFTTSYNAAGLPKTVTLPGAVTQTIDYDAVGRVTGQHGTGAEAATTDRTVTYDAAGRLATVSGVGGTNAITYDDRGLPLTITGPSGNSSFAYNGDGQMTSRTDAAGTTTYRYTSTGADTGLLDKTANSAANVDVRYAYNSMGAVGTINYYDNGVLADNRTLTYDDLHRLTSDELTSASGSVAKISYGWDKNGNETSKTTTNFGGVTTKANTYKYDQAGRLIEWNDGTTTTNYGYDKSGNRTQVGTRWFVYDARNRLTGDGATSYHYTARGTLSSTQTGSTVDTTVSDAFGQALSQQSNGTTKTYTYDGLGRVIKSGFAYTGLDNDLAADSTATYVRDPGNDVVGTRSTGGVNRLTWTDLHQDVVGQFTAASTALDASTVYDPLGRVTAGGTGMIGSLGFQSEWTDTQTGRVNMAARWYNTDTGQFDSRDTASNDPAPTSISANRYQYADARPLTATDPSGHKAILDDGPAYTPKASTSSHAGKELCGGKWRTEDACDKYYLLQAKRAGARAQAGNNKPYEPRTPEYYETCAGKRHTVDWCEQYWVRIQKNINARNKNKFKVYIHIESNLDAFIGGINESTIGIVGDLKDLADSLVSLVKRDFSALADGNISIFTMAKDILGWCLDRNMCGPTVIIGIWEGLTSIWDDLKTGLTDNGPAGWRAAGRILGMLVMAILTAGSSAAIKTVIKTIAADAKNVIARTLAEDTAKVIDDAPTVCANSFAPDTRVVMTDGSAKAIQDVRVGDRVQTSDPKTGHSETHAVTLLHRNEDTALTDVIVRDPSTGNRYTIHTTNDHPFWDAGEKRWVDAAELTAGTRLATTGGSKGLVVEQVVSSVGIATMYNLTVDDIHTYYVTVGNTPVLVHNSDSLACKLGSNGWPVPTMDNCLACAKLIVNKIGGQIYKLEDSLPGTPGLGPSKYDPFGKWTEHYAVVKDGRVYDAFTGEGGLTIDEFKAQWTYGDYLQLTPYAG